MTKWQLFKALDKEHSLPRHFIANDGTLYFGILQSIEREDGSGHSFNLRIGTQNGQATFHIRTED
jgi:hypothetical protein